MEGGREREESCPTPILPQHLGSHSSRALRVSSGDLVTFLVHLSRLAILCTCVSTAAWRWGRINTWHTRGPRPPDPCLWPHPEPRLVGSLSLPGFPPCTVLATGMSGSPDHPCSWAGDAASTQRTWVLHLGCREHSLLAWPLAVGAGLSGSNSAQPIQPAPATLHYQRECRAWLGLLQLSSTWTEALPPFDQPGHLLTRASLPSQL